MTRKSIKNIRHQAKKHEAAHKRLKDLLGRKLYVEKVLGLFILVFLMSVVTLLLFFNWSKITDFGTRIITDFFNKAPQTQVHEPEKPVTTLATHGFKTALLVNYQINGQTADQYIRRLRQIPNNGYEKGIKALQVIGGKQQTPPKNPSTPHSQTQTNQGVQDEVRQNAFADSIFLSTDLSKGKNLTPLSSTQGLQKSILATFYLGEKTVDITSTVKTDASLLGKINNALSVDIFKYMNQSSDRADSLDNYLNLLNTLKDKASARSLDLASVINFLSNSLSSQEVAVGATEKNFFANLKIFEGNNAEKELSDFIGLQKGQSEIRAKIGAYKGLKDYYDFFLPKLDNLIRSIKANRDPLIAGVKVVEIQNMTLPLIIKQK